VELLEEAVPGIPGITYNTKEALPQNLGIVGEMERTPLCHGSVEIVNEMPVDPIPSPPTPVVHYSASDRQRTFWEHTASFR